MNIKLKSSILSLFAAAIMAVSAASCQPSGHACQEPVLDMLVGTYTNRNESKGTYLLKFNQLDASFSITDTAYASNPSFVTVSDDRRFVYSVGEANDGSQCAYSYKYGNDEITVLNSQPADGIASGADPCNIILVNGSIITSNYTGGTVSAFPVLEDGTLGPMSQQFVPEVPKGVRPHMHCAVQSPDGKYLFVTDLGSDAIYRFTIGNQDNPLQDCVTAYQFDRNLHPGPRHLIFSEDGKHAYLIHELGDLLTVFRYDGGRLKHISTQKAYSGDGKGSADIHLSPDGKFLYTSHRLKEDGISIFSVNRKKGTVTNIGYCRTGVHPRNFAITPDGKWLLCACRDSNCIEIYAIDKEDGSLAFTGKTIDIPAPVCVRFVR